MVRPAGGAVEQNRFVDIGASGRSGVGPWRQHVGVLRVPPSPSEDGAPSAVAYRHKDPQRPFLSSAGLRAALRATCPLARRLSPLAARPSGTRLGPDRTRTRTRTGTGPALGLCTAGLYCGSVAFRSQCSDMFIWRGSYCGRHRAESSPTSTRHHRHHRHQKKKKNPIQ